MAIYKPSSCVPFLDTWDLTQEHNISFEINTNNNEVNGYKIRILDGKSNIIFEGENFSKINSDGAAYNGEIVEKPLIVRIRDDGEVAEQNIIYYNVLNDTYKYLRLNGYRKEVIELKNFSNGYINQPYKWQVILAQGLSIDKSGRLNQQPINNKYYDMDITSGTVIGSTPNRIQGPLSEYIYKDYFIQLLDSNKNNVGNRVLIKSYDHTYGHITPQEGVFTQDNIDKAEYFSIFKNTNDVQYVNTNRIVNNVTKDGLKMGSVRYGGKTAEWKPSEDTSKYYFIQTYTDIPRPTGNTETEVNVSIPLSNYCGNNVSGNFNPGTTTLLVRGEGTETDGVYLSAYNGVFLFVSAKWKANETDNSNGTLTITWQRPAMADAWSEFLGQSFFVQQTGENWDSTATAGGEINSTQIGFYKEKAIEIYPQETDKKDKIVGKVYKTTTEKIYIRPFIGIKAGMRFSYVKGSNSGYIDYDFIDTNSWCIETSKNEILFTPDVNTYSILSFFKTSDENPFYGYAEPMIDIKEINGKDVTLDDDFTINNRVINVVGTYEQYNNKMWKSFQWSLYDFNYNIIQYSDVKYSGEIAAQFIGLEKDHNYELTLNIEDELGRTFSTFKNFVVSNVIIVDPFEDVLAHSFDCSLHCVDASVSGAYGVVDESIAEKGVVLCSKNTICSNTLLCGGSVDKGIYYKNISIGDGISRVEGTLIEPTTGDLTLNFETTIQDDNFIGDLIGIEFGDIEDNAELSKDANNDLITVFLPDVIIDSNTGFSRVNENRYKIYVFVKIVTSQNKKRTYPVELYDDKGIKLNENNLINNREVCFGYQPSSSPLDGYDYIVADEWLDGNGNYFKTLLPENGWEYNFTSNYGGMPIKSATTGNIKDTVSGVWSDKKMIAFVQPNKETMQLITNKNNIWSDKDDSGNDNIWSDAGYGAYKQIEIKGKTGRELVKGMTLNFNLAFKNYIYKPATATDLYAQCIVLSSSQTK